MQVAFTKKIQKHFMSLCSGVDAPEARLVSASSLSSKMLESKKKHLELWYHLIKKNLRLTTMTDVDDRVATQRLDDGGCRRTKAALTPAAV